MTWTLIDSGAFNWVYRQDDLIFKVAIENKTPLAMNPVDILDNYARSVRIWNEINPQIQPPARIAEIMINGKKTMGWICPFIAGTTPTESEISHKLIDIFNRTGRIIIDAMVTKNFIKTPSGEIVCIDVGLAMQLESRDESCLIGLQRKPSFASLDTWEADAKDFSAMLYDPVNYSEGFHITPTLKALMFIKQHRPDITNADFLQTDPHALTVLATAYTHENPPPNIPASSTQTIHQAVYAAEHLLGKECDLSLEVAKQYCRNKLIKILTPSSSPQNTPRSSPDMMAFNTNYALGLLQKVNQCQHMQEIEQLFQTIQDMEQMLDAEDADLLPESLQQTAVRQMHHQILQAMEPNQNIKAIKEQCLQILTQFLSDHGNLNAQQISELKAQFSKSPREKLHYYKNQIDNQKLSDKEKEILKLIKWIDNANTFEEIDEFILKFESSVSLPTKPAQFSYLEYLSAWLNPPNLNEKLSISLGQCKLAVATAKKTIEQKLEGDLDPRM